MSEWISVKDGLPKAGSWVFIWTPMGEYGGEIVQFKDGHFLAYSYDYIDKMHPSHWMPAPLAPPPPCAPSAPPAPKVAAFTRKAPLEGK